MLRIGWVWDKVSITSRGRKLSLLFNVQRGRRLKSTIFIQYRGEEFVELYRQFALCLYGVDAYFILLPCKEICTQYSTKLHVEQVLRICARVLFWRELPITDTLIYLIMVLFWVVTQQVVVISHRRFGRAYRSHLQWVSNPPELQDVLHPSGNIFWI